MACCFISSENRRFLPKNLERIQTNYDTENFHYDHENDLIDCKLLRRNIYADYFKDIYPVKFTDNELTCDMIDVLKTYTNSQSSECYKKTNLNLISANMDDIDWAYVNSLRSIICGLVQTDIKPIYYRGLYLSDNEIKYYMEKLNQFYYTNSFLSFTVDRLLIYPGNALLILRTENSSEKAKENIANIWKWSEFSEEKEALLNVGTKLKVLSVHYFGYRWEIEVELMEND